MSAIISFEGLTKRFAARTAVDDLSFEVPEGAVCGLLGPNGAGKTTTIRVLLGLARATSGSVSILGAQPGTDAFVAAITNVGSLVEAPALYLNASGRQNLEIQAAALGLARVRAACDEALELVGLQQRAGERVKTFSLGMKQRLGLAVALLGRPRIVVLDEPTNGLDPAGIVEIRDLIRRLPERGTTVLVSSHLLAEVERMCDRATIIHRGRLIASGTMGEVLARGAGAAQLEVVVDSGEGERARDALERAGLPVRWDGGVRLAVVSDGLSGAQVNRLLVEAGIFAEELRRDESSLEDVFLALTEEGSDRAL